MPSSFVVGASLVALILVLVGDVDAKAAAARKVTIQPFESKEGTLIGLIGLGTPMQPTSMHLTTQTGDFFIIDSRCKTSGCTSHRKGYDTKASSTFSEPPFRVPFMSSFGGGHSMGRVCKESLTALAIPGKAPPSIPLPVIDRTAGALTSGITNGVFGWGFSAVKLTFLQIMMNKLDHPGLEYFIRSYKHSAAKDITTDGNNTIGGYDDQNCEDAHVFVNSLGRREWTIKLDSALIGSTKLSGGKAAIFPGAPRVYAPKAAVDAIRKATQAKQDSKLKSWTVDCGKVNSLPALSLIINGKPMSFAPREYTVKSDGTNSCVLLIEEPNAKYPGGDWVLGDPLYREHCLYLDFNSLLKVPRVGIAKSKNNIAFKKAGK